ncbi:class I SAM-dependent methyltransferase [Nocardia cyriacigeorgica]|uniref:class I SAM-dependent methyltransferase n=1 Tax=Nocardia cyriacigeorgica TaxID=135487 RepID=UPI0018F8AB18|nr:class I SAM-dependent methyltransferase [Nocardia cyriacigeorgica]
MVNEQMRQNWAEGAAGWTENEQLFDALYAPVTEAIVGAAALGDGRTMLDIGCGTGTLLAAGRAAGAAVTGIDVSPGMVEAARARVPEAAVVLGDAQVMDLTTTPGAPFDRIVSRLGVMFFDDPVAAFANIGRAAVPEAGLTFACWRGHSENPMFTLGTTVLTDRLSPRQDDPPPGAPGPTAFADPERLTSILTAAGWSDIAITALDFHCDYGIDGGDGVAQRLALILGTTTGRQARRVLEPEVGESGWTALLDEVRAELRSHLVDGVVRHPAATWLVTARRAG